MTLHIFPPAYRPTAAQLAEARRIVSVEARTPADVARRTFGRKAAWNVLRANWRNRIACTTQPGTAA